MPPENDFDLNKKSKSPNLNNNNGQSISEGGTSNKNNENEIRSYKKETSTQANNNPTIIVWRNVAIFIFLHAGALCGIYYSFQAMKATLIFSFLLYIYGGLGITAGAHRLWAHRTYKAKLPLRIFLGIAQTVALQNSIYEWCRDHRAHHKHTETNADPHNAKRGFFFSHMGWLLTRKHPLVSEKGSKIPLDDLLADPVVSIQKKYYKSLAILFCFVLPTLIPVIVWKESLIIAYFVPAILRYVFTLHATWLVNSIAHMWGMKPYDKNINPVENIFVSSFAHGEGFHNYHHTFPQDYATSEFGSGYVNLTKGFIDMCALFGLAYSRNKISKEMILQRRKRTGDLALSTPIDYRDHHSDHEHDY